MLTFDFNIVGLRLIKAWLICSLLAFSLPILCQANENLVDIYGSLPTYRSFAISPDGQHYAFISRQQGGDRFVIMDAATNSVVGGFKAGKFKAREIYFASNEHVILLASTAQRMASFWGQWEHSGALSYSLKTQKIERLLLDTRNLYPAQSGLGKIVAVDPQKARAYMPAFTDNKGGKPSYDLYSVKLDTGFGKVHARGNSSTEDWFVDAKGKVLAREDYYKKDQEHRIYSKLSGKWQLIYTLKTDIPEIAVQGVSADGKALLFIDSSNDRQAIYSMSLHQGEIIGPLYGRDDADASLLLDINRQFEGVRYSGLKPSYEFKNPRETKIFALLNKMFTASTLSLLSATADRSQLIVAVSGGDAAIAYKVLDSKTLQLRDLALAYPDVSLVADIEPFYYQARDGLGLSAVLTMPTESEAQKNLPLIVMPHGGPRAHDRLEFDWMAQFFARQGYLVLQPNFRGSSGFGYAFRDAGDGQWGLKMQDDVSDGVQALVSAGTVDPKRVCIVGASYGGYSALAGAAYSPELYRCVISIAGVSDVAKMFLEDRRQYGRRDWVVSYWSKVLGDANADLTPLAAISPVHSAQHFQAPVLLIHGKDDTVVPLYQSKLMASALKKAGKSVQLKTLKGEDHWMSKSQTRHEALAAMAKFLHKHNPP